MMNEENKFMSYIRSVVNDVKKGYWLSRKPPRYIQKAKDEQDFLTKCRDRGLKISYEETFLRNYWYDNKDKGRKVKRNGR